MTSASATARNKPTARTWHTASLEEVAQEFDVRVERGLASVEARKRLERDGPNELEDRETRGPWPILAEQFREAMMLLLIAAAFVSFFLDEMQDGVVILAIVVLNALMGFVQDYRAEKAMAALRQMSVPAVNVRRDGRVRKVDSTQLVAGDVLMLEAGDMVPADGRLASISSLKVQEAALTGESEPVEKTSGPVDDPEASIGDRKNLVYKGTLIAYGKGAAIVTATGMRTELGRIAEMLQSVEHEQTPLQKRLNQLGRGWRWVLSPSWAWSLPWASYKAKNCG